MEIMNEMDVQVFKQKDILFFDQNKVYVIVTGFILMKNHENNPLLPDTFAKYSEGDILNFK